MLDTWDQRARRDGIVVKKISFPVPPPSIDILADRLLGAITPATRVLHFCHITNLTGQIFPVRRDLRRGAAPRDPDDRRRRARVRAVSVHRRESRLRLLRHEPAQVAARADRHRLPLRAPGEHPAAVAAHAGERHAEERHPQVRGDRDAPGGQPQRHRRGADLHEGIGDRAEGGAAALPARSMGDTAARRRIGSASTRTSIRRTRARSAPCR